MTEREVWLEMRQGIRMEAAALKRMDRSPSEEARYRALCHQEAAITRYLGDRTVTMQIGNLITDLPLEKHGT